ncbi:hypothetical protein METBISCDRAFT_30236 [Metschnikowia bicuspidata]|uniref:PLP-dependent transferase n=1 Tax=Metschnikowia bicuspidata TaxID=27322 RepID=A0A4P9ZEJ6_9ASCO|nr:hypothetical protein METBISCDRAFT_30236 [Metschnikowia bicuspidata]
MPSHFDTLQLYAAQEVEKPHVARAAPIYATTSYFGLKTPGYIYSLGVAALALSSSQAAQFLAVAGLAHKGDNIVSTSYLCGATYNQFKVVKRLGIETRFVNGDAPEGFQKLIDSKTKAIYVESIGNPKYNVPDFEKIAKLAHDNPIKYGTDIMVYSATKWIGDHGTTMTGFSQPSEGYHGLIINEALGNQACIGHLRIESLRDSSPCLKPSTLSLPVERQSYNALKLAHWVSYFGLTSRGSHELAKKYFNGDNFGGALCFGVKELSTKVSDPFQEAAAKFVDNLEISSNLANVGDSKTLVIAPYYTTHQQLTDEKKLQSGVTKDLIRLSIGTEYIEDIIADF